MLNIVLFGGSLHVQYSIDIIEKENKYNIIGIIDPNKEVGSEICGYKVIGQKEQHLSELIQKHRIDAGIITIGDNWIRKNVYDLVVSQTPQFKFVNAIHPSVIIGNNVKLGIGIIVMAGCIINPNCVVGDFTFFATGAQLEHDSIIEEFASLSAGSVTGGKVKIGKYSAITLGVTIVDRVNIGENTVVGSGSVVLKDLPDNVLAYGNPAKIIRTRAIGEKFLKSG
jgi:sugar O-acyltransferase (sialic acid O-acetyltransferase NeuD family)